METTNVSNIVAGIKSAIVAKTVTAKRSWLIEDYIDGDYSAYKAKTFAALVGISFTSIDVFGRGNRALLGYSNIYGEYKNTVFLDALRNGGVVYLEEVEEFSSSKTLLNQIMNFGSLGSLTLDNGEVVSVHKDFVCLNSDGDVWAL